MPDQGWLFVPDIMPVRDIRVVKGVTPYTCRLEWTGPIGYVEVPVGVQPWLFEAGLHAAENHKRWPVDMYWQVYGWPDGVRSLRAGYLAARKLLP